MKKLAITMGDPGGVGPEIIINANTSSEVRNPCYPLVIGDASVMEEALNLLNLPLKLKLIKSPDESKPAKGSIEVIDVIPPPPPLYKGGIKSGKVKVGMGRFEKCKPTSE